MSDLAALKQKRSQVIFSDWAKHVPEGKAAAARDSVNGLIDAIVALGTEPAEDDVRAAVEKCVVHFNEIDDGWITSIERDDISETIWKLIDLAGFEGDEDWLEGREW